MINAFEVKNANTFFETDPFLEGFNNSSQEFDLNSVEWGDGFEDNPESVLNATLGRYERGEISADDTVEKFIEQIETAMLEANFKERFDDFSFYLLRISALCAHNHLLQNALEGLSMFENLERFTNDVHSHDKNEEEKEKKKERRKKTVQKSWIKILMTQK